MDWKLKLDFKTSSLEKTFVWGNASLRSSSPCPKARRRLISGFIMPRLGYQILEILGGLLEKNYGRPAWISIFLCHRAYRPRRPFQNESRCETIQMKMFLICMKMNLRPILIFIWKVLHQDSTWNRDKRQLGWLNQFTSRKHTSCPRINWARGIRSRSC